MIIPCPHCGQSLELIPYQAGQPGWQSPKTFQSSVSTPLLTSPALSPGSDYYRKTPLRDLSFTTAVLIPGARALITGVVIGLSAGGAALIGEARWPIIGGTVLIFGGAALVITWFAQTSFADSLTHQIEQLSSAVAETAPKESEPPREAVKVELWQNGRLWAFEDLPARPGPLKAFALAILEGKSYSERTATVCGLTQEEYKNLTETFVNRGLAQWKHPTRKQQGVNLSGARSVLRSIAGAALPSFGPFSANLAPMTARSSTQQEVFGGNR